MLFNCLRPQLTHASSAHFAWAGRGNLALIKHKKNRETQFYHVSEKGRLQNYLLTAVFIKAFFFKGSVTMGQINYYQFKHKNDEKNLKQYLLQKCTFHFIL